MNADSISDQDVVREAESIATSLRLLRKRIFQQPHIDEEAMSGLTGPQIDVLSELAETDGLSLKELSQRVGLVHSTVSGIVDRLEKRNFVRREIDEHDRRFVRIVVAESIKSYAQEQLRRQRISRLVDILHQSAPEERRRVIEGLGTLKHLIDRFEGHPHERSTPE